MAKLNSGVVYLSQFAVVIQDGAGYKILDLNAKTLCNCHHLKTARKIADSVTRDECK